MFASFIILSTRSASGHSQWFYARYEITGVPEALLRERDKRWLREDAREIFAYLRNKRNAVSSSSFLYHYNLIGRQYIKDWMEECIRVSLRRWILCVSIKKIILTHFLKTFFSTSSCDFTKHINCIFILKLIIRYLYYKCVYYDMPNNCLFSWVFHSN